MRSFCQVGDSQGMSSALSLIAHLCKAFVTKIMDCSEIMRPVRQYQLAGSPTCGCHTCRRLSGDVSKTGPQEGQPPDQPQSLVVLEAEVTLLTLSLSLPYLSRGWQGDLWRERERVCVQV